MGPVLASLSHDAWRMCSPISRASRGDPETVTASLKVIWTPIVFARHVAASIGWGCRDRETPNAGGSRGRGRGRRRGCGGIRRRGRSRAGITAATRDEHERHQKGGAGATKSALTTTKTRHSVTHHTEHGEQDNPSEETARCLGCIGGGPGVLDHARHWPDSRVVCSCRGHPRGHFRSSGRQRPLPLLRSHHRVSRNPLALLRFARILPNRTLRCWAESGAGSDPP